MTCSSASRTLEMFCGIQLRGFNLETYEGVALAATGLSSEAGGTYGHAAAEGEDFGGGEAVDLLCMGHDGCNIG